jgi:hypothetical protein
MSEQAELTCSFDSVEADTRTFETLEFAINGALIESEMWFDEDGSHGTGAVRFQVDPKADVISLPGWMRHATTSFGIFEQLQGDVSGPCDEEFGLYLQCGD